VEPSIDTMLLPCIVLCLGCATASFLPPRGGLLRAPRSVRSAVAQRISMSEAVVVTDGSDSFYNSRAIFQALYDFGDYSAVIALSSDASDAKKMLLSRQARYSGLVDILQIVEGSVGDGMPGATVWLALDAKADELAAQIPAAQQAGVTRIFAVLGADTSGVPALTAALEGSGIAFTVMRPGVLGRGVGGSGLKLGEIDCEMEETEMSKEDVYRFIVEAMTLPGAVGRTFSLCPSADDTQFREMRRAGCDRREEAEALLAGVITEAVLEEAEVELSAEEQEAAAKSAMESEAEREDELKALLEKARQKGIETAKARKEDEEKKAADRAERREYYKTPDEPDKDGPPAPPAGEEPPPPPPKDGGDKDGGDKDGGDEPPLAMA